MSLEATSYDDLCIAGSQQQKPNHFDIDTVLLRWVHGACCNSSGSSSSSKSNNSFVENWMFERWNDGTLKWQYHFINNNYKMQSIVLIYLMGLFCKIIWLSPVNNNQHDSYAFAFDCSAMIALFRCKTVIYMMIWLYFAVGVFWYRNFGCCYLIKKHKSMEEQRKNTGEQGSSLSFWNRFSVILTWPEMEWCRNVSV